MYFSIVILFLCIGAAIIIAFKIFDNIIIRLFSILIGILVSLLVTVFTFEIGCTLGQAFSSQGEETYIWSTDSVDLVPIVKNYYVSVNQDPKGNSSYCYGVREGRSVGVNFCQNNTESSCNIKIYFDYIQMNEPVAPMLVKEKYRFQNKVIDFFCLPPEQYHFYIMEESLLNMGFPIR